MDADAIVIGAGAAGLAAARSLAGRPLRVVLLEARDRIGGRVWSEPTARVPTPVEFGAEFIHGRAPETIALLRDAGSAAIDTGGEAWFASDDRDLQREDRDWTAAATVLEKAREFPADASVEAFLRRYDGDAKMRETVQEARAFVEGFEAADPAIASAQSIADELQSGVDFASARPIGGYGPIFARLRNACAVAGVRTHLGAAVRRVSWRRGAVEVETKNGSGTSRTFAARAAVVTLPVGVLRHTGDGVDVAFDPVLPAAKRAALGNIEMGHAVKVSLWFRTAFWERIRDGRYRDAGFFRCTGGPFTAYWTHVPMRSELIVAWAGGPKATALAGVSSFETIGRALSGFGALLGEPEIARDEFEGGVVHDWSSDPWARGAYSYVAVGGGDARAVLAAPVDDTLFFAGEATSVDGQGGTVNGALATGERAAREAAASLDVSVR